MRIFRIVPLSLVLSILIIVTSSAQDVVTRIEKDNPEMREAISKARKTLPLFWKMMSNPEPNSHTFSVKVGISDEGKEYEEFFWLIDIKREAGGLLSGTINNDPDSVSSVKLGQRYEFEEGDIADWMYLQNGKIYGNWTIRPLLKRMPKEDAERIRPLLAQP